MPLDGDALDNNIVGTAADEVINGLAGNDSLDSSGGGIDTLNGGDGNDLLYVRSDYSVFGGNNDDTFLIYENAPAVLDGGSGNDVLKFQSGYDISGSVLNRFEQLNAYGDGRLTTVQLASFATVSGYDVNFTNASLVLSAGGTASINLSATLTDYFQVTGSTQAEILTFNAAYLGRVIVFAGAGNDNITGASGNDSLRGDQGNDTLLGVIGNDTLDGSTGSDSLVGGLGNDVLIGRVDDSLNGGAGNDLLSVQDNGVASFFGGADNDVLRFESAYDITSATLTGDIESLNLYSNDSMTASQLNMFATVMGYNDATTTAVVYLTAGGTAAVNLADSLTSTFSLVGSQEADIITFNAAHLGQISVAAGAGNDSITGAAAADTMRGDQGNDTLNGMDGNDTLDGGADANNLYGGNNDDILVLRDNDGGYGGSGNDLLSIQGTQPAVLSGGSGQDTIRFENSYDITGAVISGIEQLNLYGNDYMTATQLGSFTQVQGYADNYTSASVFLTEGGTVVVNLLPTLTIGFGLTGSADADLITIGNNYIGSISVSAGAGNDSIVSSNGTDNLNGGAGDDTLSGLNSNDTLDGGFGRGIDSLLGGVGNDYLVGRTGDLLFGGVNDDMLSVQANGLAIMDGGLGNFDTLRFEDGYDITGMTINGIEQLNLRGNVQMTASQLALFTTVSGYDIGSTTAVLYLTQGGTANVTLSPTLTSNFSLLGSNQADLITFLGAGTTPTTVYAGDGNDNISTAAGSDSLRGDGGRDTLLGNGGMDSLDGGIGVDSLDGGDGNDLLYARFGDKIYGGGGDDLISLQEDGVAILNGGSGTDTLRTENSYDFSATTLTGIENLNIASTPSLTTAQLDKFTLISGYSTGYTTAQIVLTAGGTASVTLSATLVSSFTIYGSSEAEILTFNTGYAGGIGFNGGDGDDNVTAATGADNLRGDNGNDVLTGLGGNDVLTGGAGADTLKGGTGQDTLTGNSGQDVFVFETAAGTPDVLPDRIVDFEAAGIGKGDIIDLSGIDADGNNGSQNTFIFNSTGQAGLSLIDDAFGNTLVRMNTDSDARFEAVVLITDGGVLASSYTLADIIL